MFKKIMSISLAATMVAGLGIGIASCGGKKNTLRQDDAILVQVEKDWKPLYESVKKNLEENEEFKKLGIKINFKETGSFQEIDIISQIGSTDGDLSEVFAVPKDRYANFVDQKLLKEMELADYKDKGIFFKDENNSNSELDQYKVNEKLYGIPYSIESLINFTTSETYSDIDNVDDLYTNIKVKKMSLVAKDLYFAYSLYAGLLDDQDDSVLYKNAEGKFQSVLADKERIQPVIDALYPQTIDAETKKITIGDEAYNDIKTWLLSAKDRTITTGAWDKNSLLEILAEKQKANATLTLSAKKLHSSQKFFRGGWGLSVASNVKGNKYEAAKLFIKELTNDKYIEDTYKYAGKISANKKAEEKLSSLTYDTDLEKQIIYATIESYKNNVIRPQYKQNDGNFWDIYKNTMTIDGIKDANDLATKLSEGYKTQLGKFNNPSKA